MDHTTLTMHRKIFSWILVSASLIISCEDFIAIDPPKTEIVSQSVFTSDESAMSAVRGIYSLMMTNTSFTKAGIEELTGIAADELINYSSRMDQQQFYQNALTSNNTDILGTFWREAFVYINNANALLEGVQRSSGMSPDGMRQVEGEAKFIRAFCYYYLTTLFGDVPYLTSTDYRFNAEASRISQQIVFENIESDLIDAKDLLLDNFSPSNGERVQPNKGAATALLARVYAWQGDWGKAEEMASLVINNSSMYALLPDLNSVFLANSKESIWQLKPVIPGVNTPQGQLFILTTAPIGSSKRVSMTNDLVEDFEPNDLRKVYWIGTFTTETNTWYFPFKYKVAFSTTLTEYATVLRLSEQYLIRAEARAQQDKLDGAKEDINAIRNRAGLENTTANDKGSLLTEIAHERRVELFAEWGHRWLDLKRTGEIDDVLEPIKPDWQPTDKLFPIPQSERALNPNLSQNPGYE